VTIWAVRPDDLYGRSINGRTADWFRGTRVRHEVRIWAGSVEKDVIFVDADHGIDDEIDAGYGAKDRRYAASTIGHIMNPEARSTSIKLTPRATGYASTNAAPSTRSCRAHGLAGTSKETRCRSEGLETAAWRSRLSGSAACQ